MRQVSLSLIPPVVYLLLSTGTVFPFLAIGWFSIFYAFLVCTAVAFIFASTYRLGVKQPFIVVSLAFLVFFSVYLLSALRTFDADLAFRRLEGGGLVTGLLVVLVGMYIGVRGQRTFQISFLKLMLLILIMTVLQKYLTGFFDRDSRFLLNGPIVFGWFMGFSALTTTYMMVRKELSGYWIIPLTAFLLALFWTESKGPLLALFFSVGMFLLSNYRLSRARWALSVLVVFLTGVFLIVDVVGDAGRLLVLFSFWSDPSVSNESGSIAGRQGAWEDAVAIFLSNPAIGVGVGNWQFNSAYGELQYPHNLILELAAETGLVGLLPFVGGLVACFLYCAGWARLVLVFFLLCLSFSGDFSYLRYVLVIPMGSLFAVATCRRHIGAR